MTDNPHKQFLIELADLMDKYKVLLSTGSVNEYGYGISIEIDNHEIDIFEDYLDYFTPCNIRKTANEL